MKTFEEVIKFWFTQLTPKDWFRKNADLDAQIKTGFLQTYQQAVAQNLSHWHQHDEGRLAEIIVLDQFSRNMFRDEALAFAHDDLALRRAKQALDAGVMERLDQAKSNFILMPFMHSENLKTHQEALPVFEQYAAAGILDYEHKHRAIIERFGRYPHRNQILGRESSAEEVHFLTQSGSSF